jgi:hypothetical protein
MECVKPFGLTYVKHPVAIPEIAINIFWHAKAHKEPESVVARVIFERFGERGRGGVGRVAQVRKIDIFISSIHVFI